MAHRTFQLLNRNQLSFYISSLLFVCYYVFCYLVPPQPNDSNQLHEWLLESKTYLQIADEVLIFAVLALLPSIYILGNPWKKETQPTILFSSGLFFLLVIPMFVLLDLLIGRLVYPVNSYPLTKDSMIVYLSLITGTEHMISLVMALAILLFSISFRKQTKGGMVFVVGIVTFGLQIIASFSWLISPGLLLLCRLSFPIWLVLAGFLLSKNKN